MRSEFLQRGGLWVVAQNALTLAVLALGPLAGGDWSRPAVWRAVGGALLLTGAVLGVAGVRALGRQRTMYPRPAPDARLVQDGVYALMRHPLYSSLMALSLGWGLVWRSWAALAAAVALAGLLDAKARREERWLREQFAEYDAYGRRVRRFVPGLY